MVFFVSKDTALIEVLWRSDQ